MNYKEVFNIDSVPFDEKQDSIEEENAKYQLSNFNFYEPKLDNDFYLKYFISKLSLHIDIIDLDDFLEDHLNGCENPDKYLKTLNLKIIPKIKEIIDKAQFNPLGRGYYEDKKLNNGFVETEGVIKNWDYDYPHILHVVEVVGLQKDLEERAAIISRFIKRFEDNHSSRPRLKWKGKPSHLAYFVSQFIEQGYMDAPIKKDGDINFQALSNDIINTFDFEEKKPSTESIRRYVNIDSEKFEKLNIRFTDNGFSLPNSKIMG